MGESSITNEEMIELTEQELELLIQQSIVKYEEAKAKTETTKEVYQFYCHLCHFSYKTHRYSDIYPVGCPACSWQRSKEYEPSYDLQKLWVRDAEYGIQ